jgi:hypothetical protein
MAGNDNPYLPRSVYIGYISNRLNLLQNQFLRMLKLQTAEKENITYKKLI